MNKLFFLLLIIFPCIMDAQIRNTKSEGDETTVIKEKQASDEEILNRNFNIENTDFGEVIRITTADLQRMKQPVEIEPEGYRSPNARIVKRKKRRTSKPFFLRFKRNKPKKPKKRRRYKCYEF